MKTCTNLKINLEYAVICSVHFSKEFYRLKEKLMNVPMKKWKLVENAIATLFVPEEQPANKRARRSEKSSMKKEVRELLIQSE